MTRRVLPALFVLLLAIVGHAQQPVNCVSGCAGGSLSNNNAAPTNNNGGVLPAVANAAAPSLTEGNQVLQSVDLSGNSRVFPGARLSSTTPITSSNGTLNATFLIASGISVPAVLVTLDQTTTITAGAIRFEVSYDGTNFVTMSSDAIVDPTSPVSATISMPYTLAASTSKAFLLFTKGAQAVEIQVATAMTGTGSVTPYYSLIPTGSPLILQNFNLADVNGNTVQTSTTGVQKVGIVGGTSGTSLESTAGVLDENLKNVGNSAVVTAASGVQKVGIVGHAGGNMDVTGVNQGVPGSSMVMAGTYQASQLTGIGASPLLLEETGALSVQAGAAAYQYWNAQTFTGALITTDYQVGSGVGSLFLQFNSITGSPSGCTLLAQVEDNGILLGTTVPWWSTNLTVATGASTFYYAIYPNYSGSNTVNAAAMGTLLLNLTCSVYPTGGTVTAVYIAGQSVNIAGANGNSALVNNSGQLEVQSNLYGNAGGILDTTPGATAPANGLQVGGVYNSSAPSPSTGQFEPLQLDSSGNLKVNVGNTVTVTFSNSTSDSATGSAVPSLAGYTGINVGGTMRGQTGVNPTGTVYAAQTDLTSVNGTTTVTAASGVQMVGIEGHAGGAVDAATAAAVPANALYVGGNGSGNLTGLISCDNTAAVNMSTATTTQIIAISGTGGRTYICAINLVAAAADNVALISGSGTNCASNQAGLAGSTTAATGWNFPANGGLTMGSGLGMIWKSATTNNEICLVTSAATQLSGSITYTQF